MSEWRTIESAPRDGTRLLLYTDTRAGDEETLSYIERVCEGAHWSQVQIGHWDDWQDGSWSTYNVGEPIFWMPLPPPPHP